MLASKDLFERERLKMVRDQIEARGVQDPRVLEAMRQVPRHHFVPQSSRDDSYSDQALSNDCGQTISQPYIVAYLAEQLALEGSETVLEVGGGSGYQAAVLSRLCKKVISLEWYDELVKKSTFLLNVLGYQNVRFHQADGSLGWDAEAPYQAILVTAGAPRVPQPLLNQLSVGGRLVLPVGPRGDQRLQIWRRYADNFSARDLIPVSFVPLRGVEGWSYDQWQ